MTMRTATFTSTTTFTIEECCSCYVAFAMTSEMQKARVADKKTFYCPNGHSQSYTGKSDRVRREEAERAVANAEEAARIARIAQTQADAKRKKVEAELRRVNQRAKNGVCPCCNRSFVQLARHMKSKHPEFEQTTKEK